MLRSLLTVVCLLLAALDARAGDAALATLDRGQFTAADLPYLYYITAEHLPVADRPLVETALRLVIPSMAPKQQILERCLPKQVGPTLWRIDLRELHWDWHAWARLIARNPYHAEHNYFLQRADWLLLNLTDAHESQAYYEIAWGGKAPQTRDEALALLEVTADPDREFGLVEGQSGVSVQGVRLVRNLPAGRGYAWGTFDVLSLAADQDPLEQLEGDFRHDGEEWIVGVPKTHLKTGVQCAAQMYFLANGQGRIVDRAPVDLVEDHTRFRNKPEIVSAASCIQCHDTGLNDFTRNEVRSLREAGVRIGAYDHDATEEVERFHLADVGKELARNNEDYAAFVRIACLCTTQEASQAFKAAINRYDRPLSLVDAARELGRDPEELRLAIANAARYGIVLGARAKGLAQDLTEPRKAFEGDFLVLEAVCQAWEQSQ
jgi:hypothetical protein